MTVLLMVSLCIGMLHMSRSATTPAWFNNIYQLKKDAGGESQIDPAFRQDTNQDTPFTGRGVSPVFNNDQNDNVGQEPPLDEDFAAFEGQPSNNGFDPDFDSNGQSSFNNFDAENSYFEDGQPAEGSEAMVDNDDRETFPNTNPVGSAPQGRSVGELTDNRLTSSQPARNQPSNNNRQAGTFGREVVISKPPFIQRSKVYAGVIRSYAIERK